MGGLKIFGLLILTFVVTLTLLDYSRNMGMKQAVYETLRLANQSSLLEMNASYEQNEVITSADMLMRWLMNFAKNNSISFESVKLNFLQIEQDPPVYLVMIEGYQNAYAIVSKDAYVKYLSGAMIVSDE